MACPDNPDDSQRLAHYGAGTLQFAIGHWLSQLCLDSKYGAGTLPRGGTARPGWYGLAMSVKDILREIQARIGGAGQLPAEVVQDVAAKLTALVAED